MNSFLLDTINFQGVQFHIKYLTKIHDQHFMDLLPKMCSEDLNQRDLQRGDLSMHENSGQIQLDLETDIHIGTIDGGRPPQSKSSVGDLVQTRSLGMSQFLVSHRFFESGCLLPKQTFPGGEISTLEQSMFQNTFNTSQSLNHISSVVVQIPQFTIMFLMSPPEGILLKNLILFEILSDTPSFVVGQGKTIFLEQSVNSGNTTIPRFFQIFQGQTTILGIGFLSLQEVFGPNTLGIDEFGLPSLDITVQIRN
mmetsp:Transcript_31758/g.36108  ORF Transcript_31758/g.36108 Transcript_31758/m.36108 type:complete len:252 (-) Transcript_31758:2893-3648(-)